ncbi:MAG: OmpA family protein [Acidobacteria bacterium]|nr:OmpA family protein [Acidobacteriota bacterium]
MLKRIFATGLLFAFAAVGVLAQEAQTRNLASGQKYEIKGVIVQMEDANTFVVRDGVGVNTRVVVSPNTSIKNNSFWGGDRFPASALVRGLNLKVEGVGDSSGALSASKIRFDKSNLMTAQSIDARVSPAEDRITATEQNAQRLSGQIDELMAISNAAKGGAKAAQETADAAVAGVNATNKRITDIDDYVVQTTATINFKVNSSRLSEEGKAALDQVANATRNLKGYTIEVTGFASSDGSTAKNKVLSQRRAQAVIDYLVENGSVPLRRIGTSYGFGELQAVADNATREGREQNRRVEVKLLVSRGINTNVEVKSAATDSPSPDNE